MDISVILTVLTLLSGVALFLYGMSLMGDGLKQVAGNKLELILYKLTNTPLKGLLLGTAVTSVIQSSGATTVMVIGFVNSGMMKVRQAISIIMGANIGTSITGWILCLSYIEGSGGWSQLLSSTTLSAIVAIIGIVLHMFAKKDSLKHFGSILMGFAILMFGMQTMSDAMSPLSQSQAFVNILSSLSNPLLGIVFGIAITALLQSASAAVGVLQALAFTGVIQFQAAFPMIMGIGIGASVPVLLSAIGTNKNGQRTALVYLLNDTFAMILGTILFYGSNAIFHFTFLQDTMDPFSVAALNTVYRAIAMIILMPFVKQIDHLVHRLIPDSKEDLEENEDLDILEERFLNVPALALNQCQNAMDTMVDIVVKNLSRAFSLFHEYDAKKFQKIEYKESRIDRFEDKISTYMMSLTSKELTNEQSMKISEFLHAIGDYERIGDHAYLIAQIARDLHNDNLQFSQTAQDELLVLVQATMDIMDTTNEAFKKDDLNLAAHVEPLRELIGMLCDELKRRHIHRLQGGICSLEQGIAFSDLLTDMERIADHCSNIAICLLELKDNKDCDAHQLEMEMKLDESGLYKQYFTEYNAKYSI